MRRIARIVTWIGIAAWFIVVMGMVSARTEEVLCTRVEVILEDTMDMRFVSSADVRKLTESVNPALTGYPLSGIDTRNLEKEIEASRFIRQAEVSKDITGRLEIRVDQREALVRIMPRGQRGYYLDREGEVLPLSDQFTPHIMLASGFIPSRGEPGYTQILDEIYEFAIYLDAHEFWNNQLVQLYVNSREEYELIPRVGAHQILLGSMDQWEEKLDNLRLLYEQGLSRTGWNTYGTINLKYTNQVICTKR